MKTEKVKSCDGESVDGKLIQSQNRKINIDLILSQWVIALWASLSSFKYNLHKDIKLIFYHCTQHNIYFLTVL